MGIMLQRWLSTVFSSGGGGTGTRQSSRYPKPMLVNLPTEVLLEIFKYLSYFELTIRMRLLCHRFYEIISEERERAATSATNGGSRRSRLTLTLPKRRTFPANVAPWANSAFEKANYISNPELSTLLCSYSNYRGLSCRLRDYNMVLGKTASKTSQFLLEPVVIPPVQRMWIHLTHSSPSPQARSSLPPAMRLDGGRCYYGRSWGSDQCVVTVIDLVDWVARYYALQDEKATVVKYFKISLREDRIVPRRDGSVDAHVYVQVVGISNHATSAR